MTLTERHERAIDDCVKMAQAVRQASKAVTTLEDKVQMRVIDRALTAMSSELRLMKFAIEDAQNALKRGE